MKCNLCGGTVIDREVSYTIEFKERMHIIERVPAKECLQCGERRYSPETVYLLGFVPQPNLHNSLIIEATDEPDYFGFYSPDSK